MRSRRDGGKQIVSPTNNSVLLDLTPWRPVINYRHSSKNKDFPFRRQDKRQVIACSDIFARTLHASDRQIKLDPVDMDGGTSFR
ncbi:hypothetical protein AVEN_264994-1 [Araneus ventricosus]|uniref:Uncharacterized protein n=1 Tax=Araneus ventricosus TaxID=182803 RepID=A0A4Y2EPV8_ARAVE|nr:hypothetical protein AVEN_264994-1 [Araneus ventricosus]